jgi:hypothetical protein
MDPNPPATSRPAASKQRPMSALSDTRSLCGQKLEPLKTIPIFLLKDAQQARQLKDSRHTRRNTTLSPLPPPKNIDSDLISSLAKRLSKLERERTELLASCQTKDQEIARLRDRVKLEGNSKDMLEDQIDQLHSFIHSHGMIFSPEQRDSVFQYDFNQLKSQVAELNRAVGIGGIGTVAYDGIIHKLVMPPSFPLRLYANGILFREGPFRLFISKEGGISQAQMFITDLNDGFFPHELKTEFPNGLVIELKDNRDQVYQVSQQPTFTGQGNSLDEIEQDISDEVEDASESGGSVFSIDLASEAISSIPKPSFLGASTTWNPSESIIATPADSSTHTAAPLSNIHSIHDTDSALHPKTKEAFLNTIASTVIKQNGDIVNVRQDIASLFEEKNHVVDINEDVGEGEATVLRITGDEVEIRVRVSSLKTMGYLITLLEGHVRGGFKLKASFPSAMDFVDELTLAESGLVGRHRLHLVNTKQ